jgi:hypothetical protein
MPASLRAFLSWAPMWGQDFILPPPSAGQQLSDRKAFNYNGFFAIRAQSF